MGRALDFFFPFGVVGEVFGEMSRKSDGAIALGAKCRELIGLPMIR
jgi:hypothetical protein